jgi:hypothetical protein
MIGPIVAVVFVVEVANQEYCYWYAVPPIILPGLFTSSTIHDPSL